MATHTLRDTLELKGEGFRVLHGTTVPLGMIDRFVSFQNHALFTNRKVCPAGQRYFCTLPWTDWSAAGTNGKTAKLTNGTNTYAAYLGRRVGENLRMCYFDAPAMISGHARGTNREQSLPGSRLSDYRVEVVSTNDYVGKYLPSQLSWTDIFPITQRIHVNWGQGHDQEIVPHLIYRDDYEAVFCADLADATLWHNNKWVRFHILIFFYVTAPGPASPNGRKFHPRIRYEVQQIWSDPRDPEHYIAKPQSNRADPVPGFKMILPSNRRVSCPMADAVDITVTANSVQLPSSPLWTADESRIMYGDIFCEDLASADEKSHWEHWSFMPGEAIGHASVMLPHFDPIYTGTPQQWPGMGDGALAINAFEVHRERVEVPRAKKLKNYYLATLIHTNPNPNGAGGQADHGIHKLASLWTDTTGNTCWQNASWYGLFNETTRPNELRAAPRADLSHRATGGRPLTWDEFPEGAVDTAGKREAIAATNVYGNRTDIPRIMYQNQRPKNQWTGRDYNPVGKTGAPQYPAGGFLGHRSTHDSINKLTTLYRLTGSFMLKRWIRSRANAVLFTNMVASGYEVDRQVTLEGEQVTSYTSTPEQARSNRTDQVLSNVLKCLYGPVTTHTTSLWYEGQPTPQMSDINEQDTDDKLREHILDRLERKAIPDRTKGDFNHWHVFKTFIKHQKQFRWDAWCPIWPGGRGVNFPLNYTFYDIWMAAYCVAGFYESHYWLNKFRPTSPAVAQTYSMLFWLCQTWARWVIIYGDQARYAPDADKPDFIVRRGQWLGVKGYKIPTAIREQEIQGGYEVSDRGNDAYGNSAIIKTSAKDTLEFYFQNPWPYRPGNPFVGDKKSYAEKFDTTRTNSHGCRTCDTRFPGPCSNPAPAFDPNSVYCKSYSTIVPDGFIEQSGALGRIARKIADEVIADSGADADMKAVAPTMKAHVENWLQHYHNNWLNVPTLHCLRKNVLTCGETSWLDFTWATDYVPGGTTELVDPATIDMEVPAPIEIDIPDESPTATLEVPAPIESGGISDKRHQLTGSLTLAGPGLIPLERPATPTIEMSVPVPALVTSNGLNHQLVGGKFALKGAGFIQVQRIDAPEIALSVPAPAELVNVFEMDGATITASVPGPAEIDAQDGALLTLEVPAPVETFESNEILDGGTIETSVPFPIELLDGIGDDFRDVPGRVDLVAGPSDSRYHAGAIRSQDFEWMSEDSASLIFQVTFEGLDGTEGLRWCLKEAIDSPSSTWIADLSSELGQVRWGRDALLIGVFLTPEVTRDFAWRDGETRRMLHHELEVRSVDGKRIRTVQGRALLRRDTIR